jgi:hypothetical protein
MPKISNAPRPLKVITFVIILLGLAMIVYWAMFLLKRMPVGDIPIISESVTALLALITGFGLLFGRRWAVPCCLVLSGMWGYGVIAGIGFVLRHGISFDSPFGAITDVILFPLILLFSIYMATVVWQKREWFR